jgi:hypothetical protein
VRCGCGSVQLAIVERGEGRDYSDSECFLPCDSIVRENSPGTLRVTNADCPSETVDGHRKFDAKVEDVVGECIGNFYAAGAAEMAAAAVGNVGPALEEYTGGLCGTGDREIVREAAYCSFFVHDVEPAFQANEVLPRLIPIASELDQGFGAVESTAHGFFARRRCVPNAAFDFNADDFEFGAAFRSGEHGGEGLHGFGDGVELGAASAADSYDGFLHVTRRDIIATGQDEIHAKEKMG